MKKTSRLLRKALAITLSVALVFTMMPIIPGAVQKANAESTLLPAPTITVDANGVATWTEVEGASKYSVTLGRGGGWNTTGSYDLQGNLDGWNMPAGTYLFAVYAVDSSGTQISEKASVTYDYTPTHIHVWDSAWNSNAVKHWHECTASDCPVTVDNRKDSYGDHEYVDGVCVCGKELVLKAAPTITVDENGVATWTEVEGASEYCYGLSTMGGFIAADSRSVDIEANLTDGGKDAGVYVLNVYACGSSREKISEVAKVYYGYGVELIDRLNIDYTTDNANPGAKAYDLTKELRALDGEAISNGTKDVGTCFNVYLHSNTEADGSGTSNQIESDDTVLIDPNLYYFATFEIRAKTGYDFVHEGNDFDTSSVDVYINGTEMTGVAGDYYNDYWKIIHIVVPIEIDTSSKVYSIEITNSEENVAKNSTLQMNKNIVSYGEGYDAVTWSVEGAEKAGTTISETGLLTVAADETAATLTVTATATKDDTKSDTITLNVVDEIKIESVEISPETTSVFVRDSKNFTATVTGNDALDVTWTLTGNNSSDTKITPNGHSCYLEIGKYETAETLYLTVTSAKDPTKFATATITVKQSNIIDKLYLNYTTENLLVGSLAYDLTKELRVLEGKGISNGTEIVATCFNVYLNSNTEADRSGESKQIESSDTVLIDPNLYYFATFEVRAKTGFDFMHEGSTFDTSSVDVYINGTEMPGVAEGSYNDYWTIIDIVVPLGQGKQIDASDFDAKLSYTKKTYTGSDIAAPEVTVTDADGNVLVKDTDYTVEGLTAQKEVGRYKVTVKYINKYTGTKDLYYTIAPKAPSSASATLYGYDDVKFSWKKSTGASGYYVYYKKATASEYTYLTATTKTYVNKPNLLDGVKYTFKVVPYYKDDTGKYKSTAYKVASVYTLKKLATPTVTKNGTKVKVKWKNINGETGYQISKSTKKTGTNIVATYKTTTGTYKNLTATKGKTYYYKVRAYKTVDGKKIYGPWSAVKSFKRK